MLIYGTERLKTQHFISDAKLESLILLSNILDCPHFELLLKLTNKITPEKQDTFKRNIAQRLTGIPIAYIIGNQDFWKYNFLVNKHTLVPRSDSETLIETVLESYSNTNEALNILELGVGSGCLIITLLLEYCKATGIGLDISQEALKVAELNAHKHSVNSRLNLFKSDWFNNIPANNQFDMIISNPPYIDYQETRGMSYETINFEPKEALFAKENGLEHYLTIAKNAHKFLKPAGKLFIEIGYNQSQEVIKIFTGNSYELIKQNQDLQGHIRCLYFHGFSDPGCLI